MVRNMFAAMGWYLSMCILIGYMATMGSVRHWTVPEMYMVGNALILESAETAKGLLCFWCEEE